MILMVESIVLSTFYKFSSVVVKQCYFLEAGNKVEIAVVLHPFVRPWSLIQRMDQVCSR
jgi:hypothetical protein